MLHCLAASHLTPVLYQSLHFYWLRWETCRNAVNKVYKYFSSYHYLKCCTWFSNESLYACLTTTFIVIVPTRFCFIARSHFAFPPKSQCLLWHGRFSSHMLPVPVPALTSILLFSIHYSVTCDVRLNKKCSNSSFVKKIIKTLKMRLNCTEVFGYIKLLNCNCYWET